MHLTFAVYLTISSFILLTQRIFIELCVPTLGKKKMACVLLLWSVESPGVEIKKGWVYAEYSKQGACC